MTHSDLGSDPVTASSQVLKQTRDCFQSFVMGAPDARHACCVCVPCCPMQDARACCVCARVCSWCNGEAGGVRTLVSREVLCLSRLMLTKLTLPRNGEHEDAGA